MVLEMSVCHSDQEAEKEQEHGPKDLLPSALHYLLPTFDNLQKKLLYYESVHQIRALVIKCVWKHQLPRLELY